MVEMNCGRLIAKEKPMDRTKKQTTLVPSVIHKLLYVVRCDIIKNK